VHVTVPVVYWGVTLIVAVMGSFVVFTAVNESVLGVVPLTAGNPISIPGVVFSQVYKVEAPLNVKVNVLPSHTVCGGIVLTIAGAGLTIMVKVCSGLLHPVRSFCAYTVMVAVVDVVPSLVGKNAGRSPVPEGSRPIDGLSFVQ
jgi:hypothetical protein